MIVSKRTHDALIVKYTALQTKYDALVAQQKHVTQERNLVGSLLLDCLALLQTVDTRRTGGAALQKKIDALVEQARELDWLPGRVEEQEEESKP